MHNLQRFIDAQATAYPTALSEIRSGRKRSHWMWYIFPQIQGLGFSEVSKFYALQNLTEAEAYLNHPILGKRLIEIWQELLNLVDTDATEIFGYPDDLKLKSSMALFSSIPDTIGVFQLVLDGDYREVRPLSSN
jgi:uncharacterized protein (DUF1810 family)